MRQQGSNPRDLSSTLHPIEVKVLSSLKGKEPLDLDQLVSATGLQKDQVRRSLEWLSSKKMIVVENVSTKTLTGSGRKPPELVLNERLAAAGGHQALDQLKHGFESAEEFSAAVGRARGSGWITFESSGPTTIVKLADSEGAKALRNLLDKLGEGKDSEILAGSEKMLATDLLKRGILKEVITKSIVVRATAEGTRAASRTQDQNYIDALTPSVLASGAWRGKSLRPMDVEAEAPRFYPGRKHPVRDFINEVREAYISMGFSELEGGSVQPAFWNFDALFIPQDHPGRDMQDTFYLKGFTDRGMKRSGVVAKVASTHERGWKTGSAGWGYSWQVEAARRLVLRTHNTVLTIKALHDSGDRETRVFAVSKVYRNENLDYKHLAEFHQMDGIIVGRGMNVRHLMGFLREFYKKLGMKDVKLWPSYFPYTEPSLQVMGYSRIANDWIELGGSGVFRPEVTKPMGVDLPVLAWGPGIERLMLLRFGLKDLRELYDGDLKWLRERVEIASRIA